VDNNFHVQNAQGSSSTGSSKYNNQTYFTPQVDVVEDSSTIHYIYELPGVNPKEMNVELSDESVYVEGNIGSINQQPIKFLHQERRKGSFFRKLKLPVNVDIDAAKADFSHGLLKVSFPKTRNY